jgi:hypothetical protein
VYHVGDLVRYLPCNSEQPGSWVMLGGLGIIVAIISDNESNINIYKIKWLDSMEDSLLPGDFLELLEI